MSSFGTGCLRIRNGRKKGSVRSQREVEIEKEEECEKNVLFDDEVEERVEVVLHYIKYLSY